MRDNCMQVARKLPVIYYYIIIPTTYNLQTGGENMYKTFVIGYLPKADDMAQKVEEKANEMIQEGYELITMSITGTAKAILVFKKAN